MNIWCKFQRSQNYAKKGQNGLSLVKINHFDRKLTKNDQNDQFTFLPKFYTILIGIRSCQNWPEKKALPARSFDPVNFDGFKTVKIFDEVRPKMLENSTRIFAEIRVRIFENSKIRVKWLKDHQKWPLLGHFWPSPDLQRHRLGREAGFWTFFSFIEKMTKKQKQALSCPKNSKMTKNWSFLTHFWSFFAQNWGWRLTSTPILTLFLVIFDRHQLWVWNLRAPSSCD